MSVHSRLRVLCASSGIAACASSLVLALTLAAAAGAQDMPDPSQMAGRAIPAPELPNGTVTVRVVRESLGNNMPDQQVRVTVGGTTRTATTDELGRAEFRDLPAGDALAEATIDGEQLRSQPFPVPTSGGLRVVLVAGLAQAQERRKQEEAEAAAAPAVKGTVLFGGDSRVLAQFQNDRLEIFYVLEVMNNARARVDIGGPLIIDLPTGAGGASILDGSTPNASVNGDRVTVTGPFPSGTTSVQVGFSFPYSSRDITLTQTWPVAMQQLTVAVEKVGDLAVSSPQFSLTNEVRGQSGELFVLGSGPAIPAGGTLTLQISNLPLHSRTPRYVALGLALGLIGLGIWLAVSARNTEGIARRALVQRRDALLADLVKLEAGYRHGTVAADAYERRRQRMLTELERIYGELDEASAGPSGGGEGVAA